MALLTAFIGFLGRFTGKFLTTTLGWASVLLFGRIPEERQLRFTILTFGSLIWVVLLVGIAVPEAGVFLLSFVPLPDWVDKGVVRLVMVGAAVILPAVLGGVAMSIADPADRPHGGGLILGALRGYLLTPVLAITLVILAIAGIVRKAKAALGRRSTGHIAIVVRPGQYEALVQQVRGILGKPGLASDRQNGSAFLTVPAKVLAAVAGSGLRKLVPDRLAVLTGPELDLEIYPSDLSMSGSKLALARARAAILRELDSTHCWFTTQQSAQEIEDELAKVDESPASWDPTIIGQVDERLASEQIDDDEWDVLYRRRLQVAAEATGTNLSDGAIAVGRGAAADADAPELPGRPSRGLDRPGQPSPGTLVGLATAGLVLADILLLVIRPGNPRR